MNDEIKEILDRLDYNEWEVALYKVPITWCELYDIRDYITNLQQENERLKQDYINLRNYIKMRNVSTEVEDKALLYNIELENINKKKYLDYKSRCEKAIEILKEIHKILPGTYNQLLIEITQTLNILQNGSEK